MAWTKSPFLHIAVLTNAHGLNGENKVKLLSDLPDRLAGLEEVYLLSPDGKVNRGKRKILSLRGADHEIILLSGVPDRAEAEKLKGCYLSVDRSEAYALDEDQYFVSDILGMQVRTSDRGIIGKLGDVLDSPSGEIFQIERPGSKDLLLPLCGGVLLHVDFDEGIIDVALPGGLWEVYE